MHVWASNYCEVSSLWGGALKANTSFILKLKILKLNQLLLTTKRRIEFVLFQLHVYLKGNIFDLRAFKNVLTLIFIISLWVNAQYYTKIDNRQVALNQTLWFTESYSLTYFLFKRLLYWADSTGYNKNFTVFFFDLEAHLNSQRHLFQKAFITPTKVWWTP